MAKFVNYKKRSVTLPPGCKNLGDLLQPHGKPNQRPSIHVGSIPSESPPTVTRSESFEGSLLDVEKYVTITFESQADSVFLIVKSANGQSTVHISRNESGNMSARVDVPGGTAQELALRSFLADHKMRVLPDSGMPAHFDPNLPWKAMFEIAPLPTEAALLSRLVEDLLVQALEARSDSQLSFLYVEFKNTP